MPQEITTHSKNHHPHVAVLAFPFGTHAAPLFSITHHLATLSPNTLFTFLGTQKSNNSVLSNYTSLPPNVKACNVWDGVVPGYVFVGKPQEEIELFLKSAKGSFGEGMERAMEESGREVTCLVTDAFFWFGGEIAEEMGVNWVAFWSAGPQSLATHLYTDFIRESLGDGADDQGKENEVLTVIPGLSSVKIRDLQEGIVFGNLNSPFSHMLHKMGTTLPKATALFLNSFEELSPSLTNDLTSNFQNFLNIGPFNIISPPPQVLNMYDSLSWLDRQATSTVAYISFGSVTVPPPHELVAIAEALETAKVPFIWSLKESSREHLPNGFMKRTNSQGVIVPWAPQVQILSHGAVGVFVTHGGWNSVLESMVGGVPLICRPFFGDQRLNGRMVQDVWQIGVQIESGGFTKNGLINCLDQVLVKGKQFRDNVRSFKEMAYEAVGPNGSSNANLLALSVLITLDN